MDGAIPLGDQVWINGSRSKETLGGVPLQLGTGVDVSSLQVTDWWFQYFDDTRIEPQFVLTIWLDWFMVFFFNVCLCMFMYVYVCLCMFMYVSVASSFKFPELADFPDRLWCSQLPWLAGESIHTSMLFPPKHANGNSTTSIWFKPMKSPI